MMIIKQTIKLLFAFVVFMGCHRDDTDPQVQESSRPVIHNNTVYTAKGSLLRGSFTGIEYDFPDDRMITSSDITVLKQNGLKVMSQTRWDRK